MMGAVSMMGSIVDSQISPCLCVDSLSLCKASSFRSSGDLLSCRKQSRRPAATAASLELSSSFIDTWPDWRRSSRVAVGSRRRRWRQRRSSNLRIVDELGGQYEEGFDDVTVQIVNYFTYKAVRTVLHQLYEMNPPQYTWFYHFIATNKPGNGKRFIRNLVKEQQGLAERVMVTRLHLYSKWIKKCDHARIYQEISDQNLELMRERLMETVVWPSDDTNTEKIG